MGPVPESFNRVIRFTKPGTTETHVECIPIEEPGPGKVLIRMLFSGVCHSDYGICTNRWGEGTPVGQIGGHEGIGEVVKQGLGVSIPAIGAKVGIKWAAEACLTCDRCLAGGETSCETGTISGYFSPGTFQQYCVSSAQYVTIIPDGMDLAGAAPLMCGGITVYAALKRAGTKPGDWVLISGAGGGLGHLGIQYARTFGARVLAVDVGSKKDFCVDLGAEAFLDFTQYKTDAEITRRILDITGGGAKSVLMCAASNRGYAQAMSFLGFRGTLICLGVPGGPAIPIEGATVSSMVNMETTIFAQKSGNRQDASECLAIAARGLIKSHCQVRSMDSLTNILDEMEAGTINGRAVIDLR